VEESSKRKHVRLAVIITVVLIVAISIYYFQGRLFPPVFIPDCNRLVLEYGRALVGEFKNNTAVVRDISDNEQAILSQICSKIDPRPPDGFILGNCSVEGLDALIKAPGAKGYEHYESLLPISLGIARLDLLGELQNVVEGFLSEEGCEKYKATAAVLTHMTLTERLGVIYMWENIAFGKCAQDEDKTEKDCFLEIVGKMDDYIQRYKLHDVTDQQIGEKSVECSENTMPGGVLDRGGLERQVKQVLTNRNTCNNLMKVHKLIHDRLKAKIERSDRNIVSKFLIVLYVRSIEECGYRPKDTSCLERLLPTRTLDL
jgi:hypothetical protein